MTSSATITAAILVIGDEILSGRTKDKNIGYIAEYLTNIGIDLKEVRVVPDDEAEIVAALNALRSRFAYVFTTGGIGPTHDDITADCVAKAFGVAIDHDPRAVAMLQSRYQAGELNEARMRMARIPAGADLIDNPISRAPGFKLGNVIVMAGVPTIMQAMLDSVAPTLATGRKMIADGIGSYPSFVNGGFRNQIVVRGKDADAVAAAASAIRSAIAGLQSDNVPA
jgi:molybdenum cofactor synthesis domain-containing protein